jgi:hypothetical protein
MADKTSSSAWRASRACPAWPTRKFSEKHTATVVFDDQKTTVAVLISATTNAGYPSRPAP